MRILFLANNKLGCDILAQLKQQNEDIVGLVVHPESRRKYGEEIVECANLPSSRIFVADRLEESSTLDAIRELRPDIGISVLFGYILKRPLLDIAPCGFINLHPAFLPFNRGAYPNVWSIIEGTPAGTTLHYIEEGVDTGPIVAQKEVVVEPTDTGATLYERIEKASVQLFRDTWPRIREGKTIATAQPRGGTFHRVRDVELIDEIDLDRAYTGRDLLNVLRARTFPPYAGAYFRDNGKKIYLTIAFTREEESH